jgi:hypothetical protein
VLYLLPEKEFGVVIVSNAEGQQSSVVVPNGTTTQSSLDFIDLARKVYDIVSSPDLVPRGE